MTLHCDNHELELTEAVRAAIQQRAIWFYLLLKSAKERGADADAIAQEAVFAAGQLNGEKIGLCRTPQEFFQGLATKTNRLAFAMEEISMDGKQGIYRFHRCPLCDAWKSLGCTQEEIGHLCKLAMAGDYGIISGYPLDLMFNSTIGDGSPYCEMVVSK
ncbi:L-2-amino-thiazoline-4-carboxylic acid hydrolase [Azotosporobacter soli]|uniref:L-2-amino-thiazoline-4-carboxylic acid hydrolase n=1 Tax=Azotosporobacter soli TaxID=3055040 RepID=UPI0031FE8A76